MEEMAERAPLRRRHYSDDEAKEILAQAMSLSTAEGFSSGELVRFAGEMGISPAQLAAAEEAWLAEQGDRELDAERRAFITVRRREAREGLLFMAILGAVAWGATTFSIPVLSTIAGVMMIPLIVITVIVALQALSAFVETDGEDFEKAFDKWLDRREKRRARLAPPAARRRLPRVE